MKFVYTGEQTPSTKKYRVFADEGETLTRQAVAEATPIDIAPFGCRVEYCSSEIAIVVCYVD